jgi:hypothetical protein
MFARLAFVKLLCRKGVYSAGDKKSDALYTSTGVFLAQMLFVDADDALLTTVDVGTNGAECRGVLLFRNFFKIVIGEDT